MCRLQKKNRQSFATVTAIAMAFLLLASTTAFSLQPTRPLGGGEKEEGDGAGKGSASGLETTGRVVTTQRRLSGPGSSPPKCKSKCGDCTPCEAVKVVIHPGVSTPMEYYPLAWRCKCRDNLFMP